MVDFQSRDTRRGPTADEGDDEDEADAGEETGAEEEAVSTKSGADADESTATADEAAADERGTAGSVTDEPGETAADTQSTDPLGDPIAESDTDDDAATDPLGGPGPVDDTDDGADCAGAPLSDPVAVEDSAGKATDSADLDAAPARSVAVAVVTVGTAGEGVEDAVVAAFESAGHTVAVRERLRGDYDTVQQVVDRLVGRSDVDTVVTAGGVGIGADEATIEAVHPLLEKALPGFGEAFRSRLFEVIGTGIVAVRTTAGVADGTLVFCLPGDPEAAVVAVEEILVPEAPELVDYLDG